MNENNDNIVFGRNPVIETLKGDRTVDKIYVLRGEREGSIKKIEAMARQDGIPVIETDKNKLETICKSTSHQGVVAFVTDFVYCTPEDILIDAKEKNEAPFIIVVDGINDPHNLGAIIRSANASGVHGIILPKRNACGLTSVVFKAAAGACEFMKISRVSNIATTVKYLKEQNVWIYAADGGSERANDLYKTDFSGAVAIVLGDEGHGISRLVKDESDFHVKIPMKGEISSLNVSVAGAVIMYEVVRQRGERFEK